MQVAEKEPSSVNLDGSKQQNNRQKFITNEPLPFSDLLPHDDDAEYAVIGSLLIDGEAFGKVSNLLTPDSFYAGKLRACWRAMQSLWAAGSPINQVSVSHMLKEHDTLAVVTMPYLAGMLRSLPTSVHIKHYAAIVERCYGQRRLIAVLRAAEDVVFNPGLETFEMGERISDLLLDSAPRPDDLRDEHSWKLAFDQLLEEANSTSGARFMTGFEHIDAALGRGFERGCLSLLAGDTGLGKSTLALQWAVSWARLGYKVAFQSYEMSAAQLARRSLTAQTSIDGRRIMSSLRDATAAAEPIMDAVGDQSELPIQVSQVPHDILGVEGWVRRLQRQHGVDVLILDHIQEMPASDDAPNRALELDRVATKLKALATRENVLVLAVSQINRAAAGKTLTPAAIKDSGGISQSADNIIFMSEAQSTPSDQRTKMDLSIGKNRDGPDNVTQGIEFQKRYGRFVEWQDVERGE